MADHKRERANDDDSTTAGKKFRTDDDDNTSASSSSSSSSSSESSSSSSTTTTTTSSSTSETKTIKSWTPLHLLDAPLEPLEEPLKYDAAQQETTNVVVVPQYVPQYVVCTEYVESSGRFLADTLIHGKFLGIIRNQTTLKAAISEIKIIGGTLFIVKKFSLLCPIVFLLLTDL